MAITEKELSELIEPKADIERVSKISSDGKKLLVRIPQDIEKELSIKKGDKFTWFVDKKANKINLVINRT